MYDGVPPTISIEMLDRILKRSDEISLPISTQLRDGLVEDEDFRVVDHRHGQRQALAHAQRQAARQAIGIAGEVVVPLVGERVERLGADLDAIPRKQRTIVRASLIGALGMAEDARLQEIIDHHRDLFASVTVSEGRSDLAVYVDDDDLQLAVMEATGGPDVAQGAVKWNVEKKVIHSHWMDASHVSWFNSLFDQFQAAIAAGDWVGKEAREAYRCIEIISQAYRSAGDSCREMPLTSILPWDGKAPG
mgnify:CR=1 FL=1